MGKKSILGKGKIYFYGIAPTLGGYAFGYDTGSISGILTEAQFNQYFNYPSNGLQGGITASIQAGAFAGSLLTGLFLADKLGRRRTILAGSALFTIGIAISCGSPNVRCLIAGRIINGLANGCCAMMVPLWQSEVTPKEIRGRVISLQQCVINFGILSAFLIQYGCSYIAGNAAWRTPLGIQMVPTIALFCVMWFLPESPRWLMSQGRNAEALRVLADVHANGDESDEYVLAEYAEIKEKFEWEQQVTKPSYFALLFSKKYARRTYIGVGAQFWQQAVGINSILYYAPFLFQQAGVGSTEASLLSNVIEGVILNVVTWPNMYYLDTWGRRKPMILGAIGMGISMLLIGVLLKTLGNPAYSPTSHKIDFDFSSNPAAGKAVIAFLYLYVASFAISWATPAWVVPAEIFPMITRGRATSLTTATNWFVNFWFALYIPTALNNISWILYIIFAAICFAAALSTWLFQVETANRSLEEMDSMFEGKIMWPFLDRDLTRVHPIRDQRRESQLRAAGETMKEETAYVENV
ncbi:MAG: hypothetical protein M1827_007090 [Pycnora praestabilis]|nr:MAG: hypothetical protein M1827_007090 [Pycnora praestabilis]